MNEEPREVTFVIRKLQNQIRRELDSDQCKQPLFATAMQGRVIGFILHSEAEGRDAFQRDLEQKFQIRRSTASAILQTMERDGLIVRQAVPYDARLKKLVLTEHSREMGEHFRRVILDMESRLTEGVSSDELDQFFRTMEKFERNLQHIQHGEPCEACRPKEEKQ